MDLTDHQWQVVAPLFPSAGPAAGGSGARARRVGRPAHHPRPVLDAVLWKIRTASPWYDLPACYPSHQSVYRRYRQWRRTQLLDQVLSALYDDLLVRGGFDPRHALLDGRIVIRLSGRRFEVLPSPEIQDTWQLSTALVFIQVAIARYRKTRSALSGSPSG